jgi:hypothetical protein
MDKGIIVRGAGTNLTILTGDFGVIKWAPASDKKFRVTGIQFRQGTRGSSYVNGSFVSETSDQATNLPLYLWRIDHCLFTNVYSAVGVIGVNNWGVIDNCTFRNCDIAIQPLGGAIIFKAYQMTAGNSNFCFIQSNTMVQTIEITGVNEQITSGHGVSYVVRFNTFDGSAKPTGGSPFLPYEHHGSGGFDATSATAPANDKLRGPLVLEIYRNTMIGMSETYRYMNMRGGSILVWSNAMSGSSAASASINLTEDDSVTSHQATWPSGDQMNNSHFWGNTLEGSAFTSADFDYQDANDPTMIQEGRDFFMAAPTSNGGKTTWSDWTGSHQATFNSGVAQHHYPYTPYPFNHPLVTYFDNLEATAETPISAARGSRIRGLRIKP